MNTAPACAVFFACLMIHTLEARHLRAVQFGVIANQVGSFDQEVFDQNNFDQLSIKDARGRCEAMLQAWIALVDETVELESDQKNKLVLAGQIDVHRFFSSYEAIKRTLPFGSVLEKDWRAAQEEIGDRLLPLMTRYHRGLHGKNSLLEKTLATTLDPEQYRKVNQIIDQRAKNAYVNDIRVTLAVVERTVPLTRKQRSEATELLLSHFDQGPSTDLSRSAIRRVLDRMARLKKDLRKLFPHEEWEVIRELIDSDWEAEP